MSALAAGDDDNARPVGRRMPIFWEHALLFTSLVQCRICREQMTDWLDSKGLVWRMCCACDIDVANPPRVEATR